MALHLLKGCLFPHEDQKRGTLPVKLTGNNIPSRFNLMNSDGVLFSGLTLCQEITPSNSKGGLPAPEAEARVQEGGVEAELTQPLAG